MWYVYNKWSARPRTKVVRRKHIIRPTKHKSWKSMPEFSKTAMLWDSGCCWLSYHHSNTMGFYQSMSKWRLDIQKCSLRAVEWWPMLEGAHQKQPQSIMTVYHCSLIPPPAGYLKNIINHHWEEPGLIFVHYPADILRNNNVVITSKRRHFDVITSKWRRIDVLTTLSLRRVFSG